VILRRFLPPILLLLCACQEELTSPGDCPALCPGGVPQVFDEILPAITGADSSFRGYVQPSAAPALLVSNGLEGQQQRAIMRFPPRSDSVAVRDTLRSYVIDSVAFTFTILARDTNQSSLLLDVFRMPPSIDSATTFAELDPAFSPENLVVQVPVPDSIKAGALRAVLQGPDLAKVVIPPADTGVLALGIRLNAPLVTGVRLGSLGSTAPGFVTYATLNVPDTGTAKLRSFPFTPAFSSFVPPVQQPDDSTLLSVGGEPSARALIRFELPARLRDSATIVRATLELTPVAPINGLPTDPLRLQAKAVLADLGAKSPVNSAVGRVPADTIESGSSGTVSMEVVRVVEQWERRSTQPAALMLSVAPDLEAASFSRPLFYSTRAADPAVRPRLRISYMLSFPFENP
jgi:hypothetical protein